MTGASRRAPRFARILPNASFTCLRARATMRCGLFRPGIQRTTRGAGAGDRGSRGSGGRPAYGARHRVRAGGRGVLGLLGHLRAAAHERLRRAGGVDHLRAHGHRRRVLPVPNRSARLARPCGRVPRPPLARADRAVRRLRRAAHPDELPERHQVHERRRGHHHRADRPRAHHALRVRARPAPAARAGGAGAGVRPGRHAAHCHAGRDRPAGHPARGVGMGARVGRGAGLLHAHARARAEEMGRHAGHGAGHAVRRLGGVGRRAAVGRSGAAFGRRTGGARGHRARGHAGRLHAVPAGRGRRRPGEGQPAVLRRAGVGHGAGPVLAAYARVGVGPGGLRPHCGHDLPRDRT